MSIQNLTGLTLGQYELRELLGVGGMGAVYCGYQKTLKRTVAVKILSAQLAGYPDYIERFNREAETSASLQHPHIVHIYDYGTQDGISYLVMQLLSGGTLLERMNQRAASGQPLPSLGEVSSLLRQLASGLDYAHERGVIHRDIKPSNVMFDDHGNAYLVDFGIAKLMEATTSGLTASGTIIGTWAYMAPEQWKAHPITPATDQYALAVMTYALLTGRMPFEAPTPASIMHRHLSEMPDPPQNFRHDLPPAAVSVLERALAKRPEDRYPTTTQFSEEFSLAISGQTGESTHFFSMPFERKQYLATGGIPSGSASRSRTVERPALRNPAVLSLAAALLVAGLVIVFLLIRGNYDTNRRGDLSTQPDAIAIIPTQDAMSPTNAEWFEVLPTKTPTLSANDVEGTLQYKVAQALTSTATRWTATPEPSPTPTASSTATATDTPASTTTPVLTSTPVASDTPIVTETPVPTDRPTATSTATATSTETSTSTATATRTETPTHTATSTLTQTLTPTLTATASVTPTTTATATNTPTFTPDVPTLSPTPTATLTATPSPTPAPIDLTNINGLRRDVNLATLTDAQDAVFVLNQGVACVAQYNSNEIQILDIDRGFSPRLPLYVDDIVMDIAASHDGRHLAVATREGSGPTVFHDFATDLNPSFTQFVLPQPDLILSTAFSPDSQTLYAASSDGFLYAWNMDNPGEPQASVNTWNETMQNMQVIFDGAFVLFSYDKTVEIRATDPWFSNVFESSLPERIVSISYSDSSKLLAAVDTYGSLSVWKIDERGPNFGVSLALQEFHSQRDTERAMLAVHPSLPVVARLLFGYTEFLDFSDPYHSALVGYSTGLRFLNPSGSRNFIFSFSPDGRYLIFGHKSGLEIGSVPWFQAKLQAAQPSDYWLLTGTINSQDAINIRNEPDQNSAIRGQLNSGSEVFLIGRNADTSWLQILYNDEPAWVAVYLVQTSGDLTILPIASGTDSYQAQVGWTGRVLDLSNDQGIADAYVSVNDLSAVGYTDLDGAFEMSAVSSGVQDVQVHTFYHRMPYDSLQVWLDPTSDAVAQDVLLLSNPIRTVRFKVFLTDPGRTVSSGLVTVRRLDTLQSVAELMTDELGVLPPLELPTGPYLIEFQDVVPYYTIVVVTETSPRNIEAMLAPRPEIEVQSAASSGITILAGVESAQCRSTTTYMMTVFDDQTRRILAHESSATQRIVASFDPVQTSGKYLVRFDALCSAGRQVGVAFVDADPAQAWQITLTNTLESSY